MLARIDWSWVFWIGGLLVLLVGVALLLWGVFGDRARGRQRCPRCWYDLSGAGDAGAWSCSECGTTGQNPRALLRTRRRPRLMMLALVVVAAGWGLRATPRVQDRGWAALIPSTVLIYAAPLERPLTQYSPGGFRVARGPLIDELMLRLGDRALWRWQTRLLAQRAATLATSRPIGPPDARSVAALARLKAAHAIRLPGQATLRDAMTAITAATGVPIRIDPGDDERAAMLNPDGLIYSDIDEASGVEAIDAIAAGVEFGYWWDVVDGEVIVRPVPRVGEFEAWARVYDIGDLAPPNIVTQYPHPTTIDFVLMGIIGEGAMWSAGSEAEEIVFFGDWMVLHASARTMAAVEAALEAMRDEQPAASERAG